MTIQGLLLDFDGTLLDSEPWHHQAWNAVLWEHQIQLTEAQYMELLVGHSTAHCAAIVNRYFGTSFAEKWLVDTVDAQVNEWFHSRPLPENSEVETLLRWSRKAGLRVAVVTGSSRLLVETALERTGWQQLIELIVADDDVQHGKPHPEGYLAALQQFGLEPEAAVAIEDSATGAAAALAAGVACLICSNRFTDQQSFPEDTHRIRSLQDAQRWIGERLAE